MKKLICILLTLNLFMAASTGCTSKKQDEQVNTNITIRLGHQPGHTQPLVAEAQGFFQEEFEKDGITVELKQFSSGPPIIEAFAASELDFGLVGDQPAIQGKANNLDIKIIASYGSSEEGNALIAAKGSNIKSLNDLRGKKIGYTTGSVGHQLLLKFLEAAGLSESDAELLNLSPGDIFTSLQANSIDAAVTWEPYISKSVEEGIADIIQDGTGYKYNVNVIIGNTSFLEKYPDISARLLKVLNRAAKWADENTEETLLILAESSGVDASAYRISMKKFSRDLFLDEKKIDSIRDSASYLYKRELIRKQIDPDELIDTSYLQKAGITK